jgi:hypothetical protein
MKARPQSKQDPQDSLLFLRIKHPTIDPREITHALAIEPTQLRRPTCRSHPAGSGNKSEPGRESSSITAA